MPVGFNFNPRGWSQCSGALLSIAQNTALFSLLGTAFGGDGRTTFALPDLRGRSIRHVGSGAGLETTTWGERGGTNTVVVTTSHMPSHNHTAAVYGVGDTADSKNPKNAALAKGELVSGGTPSSDDVFTYKQGGIPDNTKPLSTGTVVVGNTGGTIPLNIDNPFLGVYVNIALTGIFPSRS